MQLGHQLDRPRRCAAHLPLQLREIVDAWVSVRFVDERVYKLIEIGFSPDRRPRGE